MAEQSVQSLVSLHSGFWNRSLKEPIVSARYSLPGRFLFRPVGLASEWLERDGLVLKPAMLAPERHQPPPMPIEQDPPSGPDVVFHGVLPYYRVPWLPGIVGCDLQVSAVAGTVWTRPCLPDGWHEKADLGLHPRLEWLDKLLDFTRYIVKRYHPKVSGQGVPSTVATMDMICRGVGDLAANMLGTESLYLSLYDHPSQVRRLLDWITDIHIRWASAQWDEIPAIEGGYINQYGVWSPGRCTRFQEDLAVNISERTFFDFLAACEERIVSAFPYQVLHTHSAVPKLARWSLQLGGLRAVEVALDGFGPSVEESIPLWTEILESKCLIVSGALTRDQVDMLVKRLPPQGLLVDTVVVEKEYRLDIPRER